MHRQQHSFTTQEWVLLWKCRSFDAEDVSTHGVLEPPAFGLMPNALPFEIPGPAICCSMFWNTGFGGIDIFACKRMLCYPWQGAVHFDLRLWGMICDKNMSQGKESFWTWFRTHTGRVANRRAFLDAQFNPLIIDLKIYAICQNCVICLHKILSSMFMK